MAIQSVGDQARAFALQIASNRLKLSLATLTQEMASGESADIGTRLQGNTRVLSGIEARIAAVGQFQRNASDATILTNGVQDVLEGIRQDVTGLGTDLTSDPFLQQNTALGTRTMQIANTLDSVINRLNGAVAGRFMMGGLATGTPPVAPAAEILDRLVTATAGLTIASDVAQVVSDWFDAAPGAGGYLDHAYFGTLGTPQQIQVGEGTTIALSSSAASPEIRDMLKGLAMAALPGRGVLATDMGEAATLMRTAGRAIYQADRDMIGEMGRVGLTQQFIAQANHGNTAALSVLSLTRNEMRSVDPFETTAALTEVQSQLEALYAVTARLSKLKLADFIR